MSQTLNKAEDEDEDDWGLDSLEGVEFDPEAGPQFDVILPEPTFSAEEMMELSGDPLFDADSIESAVESATEEGVEIPLVKASDNSALVAATMGIGKLIAERAAQGEQSRQRIAEQKVAKADANRRRDEQHKQANANRAKPTPSAPPAKIIRVAQSPKGRVRE